VLQSIFDDVDLTPIHYSRFCLTNGPHKTIDILQTGLGVKKGQPKKVSEELVSGIKMHLESGNVQVSDALRNVIYVSVSLSAHLKSATMSNQFCLALILREI
jgi:hypothetical protein